MTNIKWIGTQELGKDMEPLLTEYETVFIECEYHVVLMRAIRALKELRPHIKQICLKKRIGSIGTMTTRTRELHQG